MHRFLQIGRRFVAGIREHRQPIFFHVSINAAGMEYRGKHLDISGGGMFVGSRDDILVGTLIELSFSLSDPKTLQVSCRAEVAWKNCKPIPRKPHYPLGLGLKFVALPPSVRAAIVQLSDSVCGMTGKPKAGGLQIFILRSINEDSY